MIDKKQESENYARRRQFALQKIANERLASFKNTGALLTQNNKIILPHASDADYSSDTAAIDFMKERLHEIGADGLAEEAGTSLERLIDKLLDSAGEESCTAIVQAFFTKKVL